MAQNQVPDQLFFIVYYTISTPRLQVALSGRPLTPPENYWADFCKRKFIEKETLYVFNDQGCLSEGAQRRCFFLCLTVLLLLLWIGLLEE